MQDDARAKPLAPEPCGCGKKPVLYTAAGEFRLKCSCGLAGIWGITSLGALNLWNAHGGVPA